jgi:hypothetical protein
MQNLEHMDALATMEFNQVYKLNLIEADLKGIVALLILETSERKNGRTIANCDMFNDLVESWRWKKWPPDCDRNWI